MTMKNEISILAVLILSLGLLTACGDNKAKDKLLGGVDYGANGIGIAGMGTTDDTTDVTTTSTGTATATNPATTAQKDSATQATLQAAEISGSMGTTLGTSFAPPYYGALLKAFQMFSEDVNGYYYINIGNRDAENYIKGRFTDATGGVINPNDSQTMHDSLAKVEVEISESGGVLGTFTCTLETPASDMITNGTVTMGNASTGVLTFTVTNMTIDAATGAPKGGTITCNGPFLDGTTLSLTMTFNTNGSLDGTAAITSATINSAITVHINADHASGTYVDETGTHDIPTL